MLFRSADPLSASKTPEAGAAAAVATDGATRSAPPFSAPPFSAPPFAAPPACNTPFAGARFAVAESSTLRHAHAAAPAAQTTSSTAAPDRARRADGGTKRVPQAAQAFAPVASAVRQRGQRSPECGRSSRGVMRSFVPASLLRRLRGAGRGRIAAEGTLRARQSGNRETLSHRLARALSEDLPCS